MFRGAGRLTGSVSAACRSVTTEAQLYRSPLTPHSAAWRTHFTPDGRRGSILRDLVIIIGDFDRFGISFSWTAVVVFFITEHHRYFIAVHSRIR